MDFRNLCQIKFGCFFSTCKVSYTLVRYWLYFEIIMLYLSVFFSIFKLKFKNNKTMQQFKIHFSYNENEGGISLLKQVIKADNIEDAKTYLMKKYDDFFMIDFENIEIVTDESEEKSVTPTRWSEIIKIFARYKLLKNKNVVSEIKSLDKRSKYVLFIATMLMLISVGLLFVFN